MTRSFWRWILKYIHGFHTCGYMWVRVWDQLAFPQANIYEIYIRVFLGVRLYCSLYPAQNNMTGWEKIQNIQKRKKWSPMEQLYYYICYILCSVSTVTLSVHVMLIGTEC